MDRVPRCRLLTPFQEGTPEIVSSGKNLNSASKMVNLDYSRYSQVSLLTLCYHWQTLSIFLLEMEIAKDH